MTQAFAQNTAPAPTTAATETTTTLPMGAPAPAGSEFMSLLPLVAIFVVFYFLIIRPQQRRMKDHRTVLGTIKAGDKIVTGGGKIGRVVAIEDQEVVVELADNVRVRVVRNTIANVLTEASVANDDVKSERKSA